MYLSMVVFEECLAEYHPRMIGHSDLIKIKFMGVQEAMEGQEYLPDHMLLEHVEYFVSHPVPAAWGLIPSHSLKFTHVEKRLYHFVESVVLFGNHFYRLNSICIISRMPGCII